MISEGSNALVDISVFVTLYVFVDTLIGVGAIHIVQVGVNECVLHEILDVLDLVGGRRNAP